MGQYTVHYCMEPENIGGANYYGHPSNNDAANLDQINLMLCLVTLE